jgi:hypothetical protein
MYGAMPSCIYRHDANGVFYCIVPVNPRAMAYALTTTTLLEIMGILPHDPRWFSADPQEYAAFVAHVRQTFRQFADQYNTTPHEERVIADIHRIRNAAHAGVSPQIQSSHGRCAPLREVAHAAASVAADPSSPHIAPQSGLYAEELRTKGVTVIPCLAADMLPSIRHEYNAAVASFPEFKAGATAFVMGGFSALGNPASFHNPFVRQVRQWCMHAGVTHLWSQYIQAYKPAFKLEQCVDRMMLRPAGVSPSAESWHRDEAKTAGPNDETFGGWINLDSQPQFFNCVLETHTSHPNQHGGFAPIKDKNEQETFTQQRTSISVPPGHIVVFFEHIVHEVRAVKSKHPMYRVFTGWRITDQTHPLIPSSTDALLQLFREQAVMPLKSGQTPPMYAKLHWTNWTDAIVKFSQENVIPACTHELVMKSGKRKGEVFRVVHQCMGSLLHYRLPLYAPYEHAELAMHIPDTVWTVLRPGSRETRDVITLY